MSKFSALSIAALLAAATAQAATITIPDFDITPGGTYVAAANVSPDADGMFEYDGFQFDLSMLPAGISIDFEKSSPMDAFKFYGMPQSDGSIRLMSYTDAGDVTATDNILKIMFSASEAAAPGTYTINIDGVIFSSATDEDIYASGQPFTITVKAPAPGPEQPDKPYVPATPIPDGMYGNDNGTYISALKIREGNMLTMGLNNPVGGYENSFEYLWYDPTQNVIGVGREIETPAQLWGAALNSGNDRATSENVYMVNASNYDPDGNEFWEEVYSTASVLVYKRPQIPTQLLRKGQHPQGGQTPETGTSHTFVIMMTPLSDAEVASLAITYTYGYTDSKGEMYILDKTNKRYTHTTAEIYNNKDYTFWAYTSWTYDDGSIITSGLRYLDGGEDPDFDASVIDGVSRRNIPMASEAAAPAINGIYTFDGRCVGTDFNALAPGMYIVREGDEVRKVIKN